jgi:predicted Zn-dependent protease
VLISPAPASVVEPAAESAQQRQPSNTANNATYLTEPAQITAPEAKTPVATPAPILPVASQQVVEQLLADADKAKAESKPDVAIMKLQQAQRIAPREPKVYARLAALYLSQGQAARAEQMARKGLTTAVDRPGYGHFFWRLIAASRRYLGDTKGEAQALAKAQQLKN